MIDIGQQIDYKIVPTDSLSIIGSNSKHTAGDLYTIDIKLQISQPYYKRLKRLLDLAVCIILLPLLPLLSVALGNVVAWWRNWVHVGGVAILGWAITRSRPIPIQADHRYPTNTPIICHVAYYRLLWVCRLTMLTHIQYTCSICCMPKIIAPPPILLL